MATDEDREKSPILRLGVKFTEEQKAMIQHYADRELHQTLEDGKAIADFFGTAMLPVIKAFEVAEEYLVPEDKGTSHETALASYFESLGLEE